MLKSDLSNIKRDDQRMMIDPRKTDIRDVVGATADSAAFVVKAGAVLTSLQQGWYFVALGLFALAFFFSFEHLIFTPARIKKPEWLINIATCLIAIVGVTIALGMFGVY